THTIIDHKQGPKNMNIDQTYYVISSKNATTNEDLYYLFYDDSNSFHYKDAVEILAQINQLIENDQIWLEYDKINFHHFDDVEEYYQTYTLAEIVDYIEGIEVERLIK